MKSIISLFFISFLFIVNIQSQDLFDIDSTSQLKLDVNGHFSVLVPMNQLRGNMDPGFGFGLTALFGKKGLPIYGGLDYRFHWHNRAASDIYIYNGYFDEEHDFSTTSYSHQGDIMLRIAPELDFPIIPYADVFFGFNRFSTWTSVEGEEEFSNDPDLNNYNNTYREAGDWTRAYGAGAGCRIRLYQAKKENEPILMLNLRAAYRKGGIASYLVKKDDFDIIDSTIEAYEEKESTTDFLIIQLGITVTFN